MIQKQLSPTGRWRKLEMSAKLKRHNLLKLIGATVLVLLLGVYLTACASAAPPPTSSHTPSIRVLDNAESASGWAGSNTVSLDTADKQEGNGALTSTGLGPDWFKKTFSTPVNAGVTEAGGFFKLWIYVSNATKINTTRDAQIELTSSGGRDVNEYSWNVNNLNLVNGWNLVSLRFSDAVKIGSPDLNAINYFRIYGFLMASITRKIDGLRFEEGPPVTPAPTATSTPTPIPRNSQIITPQFPTDDVVVIDYNVVDYSADPNGVNDSTIAIQRAIDDCYQIGGGTVWLPAGSYKVSSTLYVRAFVTLRGDRLDPDSGSGSYGTVIRAELASGETGPVLFEISGSAAVMGVTTFYPNQNATNPVPYNFTFFIPGTSSEGYMASSVINVTMLNSYKGIGTNFDNAHELTTIQNVKGTLLKVGVEAYNNADVGIWEHIYFKNQYWANAGSAYNAPDLATLNAWTRANGTAFKLGDLEWDQFFDIACSDYDIGIHIVHGARVQFAGQFLWADLRNTNIAVKVDHLDPRWGMSFLRSNLEGSTASIQHNAGGYVKVTDSTLVGPSSGIVQVSSPGTSPVVAPLATVPRVSRAVLYDVSKAPYNAPFTSSQGTILPSQDATSAIQAALNDAGYAGGGVVYLPAGWYRINTHLTVPANVELRGSAASPSRDQSGLSAGTVLFASEGEGTTSPQTATAFITLDGNTAGLRGLRIFYPNNPLDGTAKVYPFAIRGNGANVYVVYVTLVNGYLGIDLRTHRCNGHYVHRFLGLATHGTIFVGPSTSGWISGVHSNIHYATRNAYGIAGWLGSRRYWDMINNVEMVYDDFIVVDGASNETVLNSFIYGGHNGFTVTGNATANFYNVGIDNAGGTGIKHDSGVANVMNFMIYTSDGTKSSGSPTIYNLMSIR
jgi:hypothetical protein